MLDLSALTVPDSADDSVGANADQARLWLGWGDWNVIASVSESNLSQARRIVSEAGAVLVEIGKVVGSGAGAVSVSRNGLTQEAPRLESVGISIFNPQSDSHRHREFCKREVRALF